MSHLYAKIKEGSFPQQVRLGGRGAFWVEDEIEQWVRTEIAPSKIIHLTKVRHEHTLSSWMA
jgi:predicted DNA-binding transcriptional regulator AlpA